MKRLLTITVISILFVCDFSIAQTIDSVTVEVTKKNNYNGVWEFYSLNTDSFSNGLIIAELKQSRAGTSWQNDQLTNYVYISSVLNSKTILNWNTNQWVNTKRWTYLLSGNPDSILYETWNGSWINSSLTITLPNSIGSDSVSIIQEWVNTSWRNSSKIDFSYSPDSTLLTKTTSYWDTTLLQWNIAGRTLYEFIGGFEASEIEQNYSNGTWINYMRYSNPYLLNGTIFFESSAGWSDVDSAFSITHSSGFTNHDSLGRPIYFYHDYTPGGFSEITIEYDSNGNMLTKHSYSESMGGIVSDYFTYWFYYHHPSTPIHLMLSNNAILMCSSDSVLIDVFAFGGMTALHFNWTPAAGLTSDTVESPYVISDTTTNYILTVSDDSSNTASDTLNVTVIPDPLLNSIQSIATSCIGCGDGEFILDISGYGPPFNIWCDAPFGTFSVTDSSITGLHAGVYLIMINDTNGCRTTLTDTIFDPASRVSAIDNYNFNISPNPFISYFIFSSNKIENNMRLDIVDNKGITVRTENIHSQQQRIDRKDLKAGTYLGIVRVDDREVKVIRIVVTE